MNLFPVKSDGPQLFQKLIEISVVVTPWYHYVVMNHNNPSPRDFTNVFVRDLKLNGGKHIFSLKNETANILKEFPKWLDYHLDLKIEPDSIGERFKFEGGLVRDLLSDVFLTERGKKIQDFHKV